jgi:hypothetical protein
MPFFNEPHIPLSNKTTMGTRSYIMSRSKRYSIVKEQVAPVASEPNRQAFQSP